MELSKCYTANGNFDVEQTFIQFYGAIPSKYELCIETKAKINTSKTDLEKIKKFFNKIDLVKYYFYNDIVDEEDVENDSDPTYVPNHPNLIHPVIKTRGSGSIIIAGDNKIVAVKCDSITVCYVNGKDSKENIMNLADDIYSICVLRNEIDFSAKISLINVSQGDYYTQTSKIDKVELDVYKYYNDDFLPVFEDIKQFLNTKGSGLILLSGKIGSGKTTFIRYLCSNYPHEYIVVPNSIASRMGDPELVSFMTDHEDSIFILEDCEQLLEDRSTNMFNNAISTILNMADGLLSDILNIKLICTFNADITSIDPALLRKGRCFARYEFGDLCKKKVKILNDEFNLNLPVIKPMTLAEVFNNEQTDYTNKQIKLGF